MWLVAFLMLGLLAWGGYYVCNHGFSRHWRVRVSQEFKRRGLDLYVHRLTLDPIQGLVARDVQIFDVNTPGEVVATIDRAALDINLTNLLHSRPFIDAVDLRNADLSLPVNPDDPHSERVKVSHLNARIFFRPHEWYASQAEATVFGMQISARGRLLNPEAFQPGAGGPQHPQEAARSQMAFDLLKQIESAAIRRRAAPHRDQLWRRRRGTRHALRGRHALGLADSAQRRGAQSGLRRALAAGQGDRAEAMQRERRRR